jgi:signal transduction histidine kinase/DNA-binding response OmpR family regulator/HAMP domain-containing protein
LTDNVNQLAANLTMQVRSIAEVSTAVTKGDLTRSISVEVQGELAALKDNINEMILNLKETTRKNTEQDWLKTNVARFTRMVQGQRDLLAVSKLVLSELAPLVDAQQGIFYIMTEHPEEEPKLKLLASYAFQERRHLATEYKLGEGLVGQCALEQERIQLTDVPPNYIKINSGLGEATPLSIVVLPVLFEGQVKAVVELASFHRFSDIHLAFLDQLTESIGIVLNTITATMRTEELLKQSQALAEELQSRQDQLTTTNKRLEQQAATLQASEELLKNQQEQLQRTNDELQEKAALLADQKTQVEWKNREVEQAKLALEEKAEQLALTSKYKSEFLANMSHELRTPLNNLLILANMLAENAEGNLTSKQTRFAETIHSSGTDLLALITDILDLSKIESGTMVVEPGEVRFADLREYVSKTFRHVADGKGLDLRIEVDRNLPELLTTDLRRLQQVLKNLLSNALKFTEKGSVTLRMHRVSKGWRPDHPVLDRTDTVVAFSVNDTGIGIPPEKQRIIFEAFQQADGTTSRKYGGTGLGLSISREIARLLGGEIALESAPGVGSTFTLYLPQFFVSGIAPKEKPDAAAPSFTPGDPVRGSMDLYFSVARTKPSALAQNEVDDDRGTIQPGDRTLLIVEDDSTFARILLDLAHEKGFKGLVAPTGDEALALARKTKPDAITLDIHLPDTEGWTVLDRLKNDAATRHIPVHILSIEEDRRRGLSLGAFSCLQKSAGPNVYSEAFAKIKKSIENRVKNLLVVEEHETIRKSMEGLIANHDVHTTALTRGDEAIDAIRASEFDCIVIDSRLPDMSAPELIANLQSKGVRDLPIIVFSGDELSRDEEAALERVAENLVLKRVRTLDRLLDETALFLHSVESTLPEADQKKLQRARESDVRLAGSKILIVDDDVRNIFALTSVLERKQMEVVHAENGRAAIETLQKTPDVDIVLMDVMMPEMDGYETMRAIRRIERFRSLPIIALTAKAMKGDREKCVQAGASDYIPKPVDLDHLFSLLRVWRSRARDYALGAGSVGD